MDDVNHLQSEVDRLIAAGEKAHARRLLTDLWNASAGPVTANFVISRSQQLGAVNPVKCKVAVVRSFTVEPVVTVLRAAAWINGIELRTHIGDFNTYAQEILNPNSSLYEFGPDVVILAVQTRDIAPALWRDSSSLSADDLRSAVYRVVGDYESWIAAFRRNSQAHLLIHNLELPSIPAMGILDGQRESSQSAAIRQINNQLQQIARKHSGVYVLDYDALVARHGRGRWHDERKWLMMRMPIAVDCLVPFANEWLRFLHPVTGRVCKAVVVDLDNTLWGGVVGENGTSGIVCGAEYPGAAFQGLQRALLDLYRRGILLAICSKNNPGDALEALEKHPGLLLRPQHFAAMKLNWIEKSTNLREIAKELNIGVDSLAFLDDNPVERQQVRMELPEVVTIPLPKDPLLYEQTLRACPFFERLSLSEEDRERGRMYAEQRERAELQQSAGSLEEFYRSLDQEVELAYADPDSIARVSQLTQKTNQFNLTTRRYSEPQIAERVNSRDWRIVTAKVRDRFGDNGLVGVAMIHLADGVCEIDSFLLSCRVIGRAVETVLLAFLIDEAKNLGARRIQGWFLPTAKNAPAKEFYAKHGFTSGDTEANGNVRWSLELATSRVVSPEWMRIIHPKHKADLNLVAK